MSLLLLLLLDLGLQDYGADFKIVNHVFNCQGVAVLGVKQNHGCWEVDISGNGIQGCLQGMGYFCKAYKGSYRCRIMGSVAIVEPVV